MNNVTSSSLEHIQKKAIVSLRTMMKPNLFGDLGTIKPQWYNFAKIYK